MPLVRHAVRNVFWLRRFEETRGDIRLGTDYHRAKGPQLNTSQNPDEAVALGAAIQRRFFPADSKMFCSSTSPAVLGN